MNRLLLVMLSVCFFLPYTLDAQQKEYGDLLVTELVSVYDGDTFKVNMDDVHPLIGEKIGIRIYGIDTPEMRSPYPHVRRLAAVAKQYLEGILQNAEVIELSNIRRGKYFRIVADVFADGEDVAKILLDAGLAKPYDGKGPKPVWTNED